MGLKKKILILIPIILIIILSTPISYSEYDYLLLKSGIDFKISGSKGIFNSNIDLYTSKCEFINEFVYFTDIYAGSGSWSIIAFSTSPSNVEMTLTQLSTNKIRLNIIKSSGISTTKIYLGFKGEPTKIPDRYESEYDEITKTFTIHINHDVFDSHSIYLDWSPLDFADQLIGGSWVTPFVEFYTLPLGPVAPAIVILTLSLAAYITTQKINYVIGLWLLCGAAIEIFLPGPALKIGRIFVIMGIFVLFLKLFLGRRMANG